MEATRRLRTAMLILALVAAPLLAGCIGVAQASAMEYQDTAHARAKEWDANARLIRVVGVEGSHAPTAMTAPTQSGATYEGDSGAWGAKASGETHWERAGDDERVGDGLCELWMYAYVAPDKDQKLVIVTDRDGKILHQETEPLDDDDHPIGTWKLDSDDAVEKALEANSGLREGLDSENYGLAITLHREDPDENARWAIVGGGGDRTGGGGGIVLLDAVTGEVLASHGGHSQA